MEHRHFTGTSPLYEYQTTVTTHNNSKRDLKQL
jgi:hypothetical protein